MPVFNMKQKRGCTKMYSLFGYIYLKLQKFSLPSARAECNDRHNHTKYPGDKH